MLPHELWLLGGLTHQMDIWILHGFAVNVLWLSCSQGQLTRGSWGFGNNLTEEFPHFFFFLQGRKKCYSWRRLTAVMCSTSFNAPTNGNRWWTVWLSSVPGTWSRAWVQSPKWTDSVDSSVSFITYFYWPQKDTEYSNPSLRLDFLKAGSLFWSVQHWSS